MCDVLDRWTVALKKGVQEPPLGEKLSYLLLATEQEAQEHLAAVVGSDPTFLEVRRVALFLPCEGGEKNHMHPTPREDLVDALNRRSRANEILRSIGQLTGKESVDELLFKAMKPPTH